ncbi:hypothetical protein BDQ17DRAFT_618325 [Cyathus striatus]|nr:hypothetical protein BDQ17DRAFT_618325 [Cyathus striatus]
MPLPTQDPLVLQYLRQLVLSWIENLQYCQQFYPQLSAQNPNLNQPLPTGFPFFNHVPLTHWLEWTTPTRNDYVHHRYMITSERHEVLGPYPATKWTLQTGVQEYIEMIATIRTNRGGQIEGDMTLGVFVLDNSVLEDIPLSSRINFSNLVLQMLKFSVEKNGIMRMWKHFALNTVYDGESAPMLQLYLDRSSPMNMIK